MFKTSGNLEGTLNSLKSEASSIAREIMAKINTLKVKMVQQNQQFLKQIL